MHFPLIDLKLTVIVSIITIVSLWVILYTTGPDIVRFKMDDTGGMPNEIDPMRCFIYAFVVLLFVLLLIYIYNVSFAGMEPV